MKRSGCSRRAFLEGLGIGLGWLPLLNADRARAQGAAYPRRLMVVLEGNGTIHGSLMPSGDGSDLAKLAFPEIAKPLEPYRSDLTFIDNLDPRHLTDLGIGSSLGHQTYEGIFSGVPGVPVRRDGTLWPDCNGPTFDQVIVDRLAQRGLATQLPKLHLGVQSNIDLTYQRNCFFRAAGQPAALEFSPARAAGLVFGKPAGAADSARVRAEKRSMLDFVMADLARFRRTVGRDDQVKIDAHLASIRELDDYWARLRPVDCGAASQKTYPADDKGYPNGATHRDVLSAHLDIAVAALACNVTRIVTVQLSSGQGFYPDLVYPWLGLTGPGLQYPTRSAHDIAHRPGPNAADKIKVELWYAQQLAALIERMKAVKEGSGTLLDNTAILWAHHMDNGAAHNVDNLPWIVAGRCGGAIRTGQLLRLPRRSPTHSVLIALANAMGADIEHLGDPRYAGECRPLRT
jgi:hypothetical protein